MKWREPKGNAILHMTHPKGFDDYDFRLGDILRGERATLGKSLLDVEKELKIKPKLVKRARKMIRLSKKLLRMENPKKQQINLKIKQKNNKMN